MRIAVMIIALCLTAIVGLQSCTVMVGGGLSDNQNLKGAGAIGIFVALLFVAGAAFAIGLPKVSRAIFGVAAVLSFIAAANGSGFSDMTIWGFVALGLGVMSHFGSRELRNKRQLTPRQEVPTV